MSDKALEYVIRLKEKRIATGEELGMYRPLGHGRSLFVDDYREFVLDREDEHDSLDLAEKELAQSAPLAWLDNENRPDGSECADEIDHRSRQSPVKDQMDRGTCVCFASLANLEALLPAGTNLSEQYANWVYMRLDRGATWCDDGLRTTQAARYLSLEGVCPETECAYEDRATVNTHCATAPSGSAKRKARFGVGSYKIIDRLGLLGPSIANSDYLEALICKGFDIVLGTNVAWGRPDQDGVYDVILDQFGNPLQSRGGHAMLIVGYKRSARIPYFIVKNSWGVSSGVGGYYYLSYDYMRTYSKYGYVVEKIRTDMPTSE